MNAGSASSRRIVFLLDADNTLLDNDRVVKDLKEFFGSGARRAHQQHYWMLFEQQRAELGYADYLGTLQRCRLEDPRDQNLLAISSFLLDYPFRDRLFPGALAVIKHLNTRGQTVILTDGDVVFQPRKIERSGLFDAVEGRVLLYIHKEQQLEDIERRYPADHYVLVDDKVRILAAVKQIWNDRVTTVFPRQGHYATDPAVLASYPPADLTVAAIADLLDIALPGVEAS
jgi:FMN phosphatase YigB (HAD superfamily)